jgi:predicted CopG family antitoxin
MEAKIITLDQEAYSLLFRSRKEGQSFSQVIKEHFAGGKTGKDLQEALKSVRLSEETLAAIEEQIALRQAHRATAPEL